MKIYPILILMTLVLAACAGTQLSPANPGEANNMATNTPAPAAEPTASSPTALWDTSPGALIISITHCCGFVPEVVVANYLPQAQVWGDGRIVWTQTGANNERIVLEGRLTPEQLASLLAKAKEIGFFEWQELFTDPMAPTDMPSKCIAVTTAERSNRVCEYFQGAPQAFHDFYATLAGGVGVEGSPYTPTSGYLVARQVPGPDQAGEPGKYPAWDVSALGASLAGAGEGLWVEGQALQTAWELVNENPWGPMVEEDGKLYHLSLQIPGVSMNQPPQR